MSSSSPTSTLNVEMRPGKLPMLRVDAIDDGPRWVAEHRDTLRAAVVQHGSLLLRGLGLRDVAGTEAVFRKLGSLMTEREAFAPRRRYSNGVYSASTWPPNQHMCMHHELSYALECPSLMLFACLIAPTDGGETPVADSRAVLHALPGELVKRFEREGGLPFNTRFGNGDPIGADVVQVIDEVYEANTRRERWQAGDLMLMDNIRTAHARESFEGPREVVVAMADAVRLADCSPTIEVMAS